MKKNKSNTFIKYKLIIFVLLFTSCQSDSEKAKIISNRILKIEKLRQSKNINRAYLNSLDDSLNMIKIDLSNEDLNKYFNSRLNKELDSVKNNIFMARIYYTIIGNTYSYESPLHKVKRKLNNYEIEDEIKEYIDIEFKDDNKCEIRTYYFSKFVEDWYKDGYLLFVNDTFIFTSTLKVGIDPTTEIGTYNYIGNKKFEVSNGLILKVENEQDGVAKLYKKINSNY